MVSLFDASAIELAAWIRSGEVCPVQLVDTHIERIEAVNDRLNAVVAERFAQARAEALAAREQIQSTKDPNTLPPLLGVPCTIKEFIAVKGLPQTAGLIHRRGTLATEDASLVQNLRAAGAIILGTTNVPEGGLCAETNNTIYGRTNNPFNSAHTSGGSSGGEAAIIGSGASVFGVGSDIGGSIRMPASFCGIAGHKPTPGIVPLDGHFPPASGELAEYMVCGPLARRVKDLMPLMRILAGEAGGDTGAWPLRDPASINIEELTVYPVEGIGRSLVSKEVRESLRSASAALVQRGATLGELDERRFRHSLEMWAAALHLGSDGDYSEIIGGEEGVPLLSELIKLPFGRSRHIGLTLAMLSLDRATNILPLNLEERLEEARALQTELELLLGPRGLILHPTYGTAAPRHNGTMAALLRLTATPLFNVLQFPGTQVPTGFSRRGLPLGIQVVASRGQDHLCIAAAQAIEDALGGWQRPDAKT